jgi:hypothetical protein
MRGGRAAVPIETVSDLSVPKTGMFAASGGDFSRFGPPKSPIRKSETDRGGPKGRHWRAFLMIGEQVSQPLDWLAEQLEG